MASNASAVTIAFPPHPSSTLVNISDDADLRLIRLLAPSSPNPSAFEEECNAAIANGDAATLLRTVISHGTVAGLLTNTNFTVDEAVSVFSLLTVYLDRVGDVIAEKELCGALADAVVSGGVAAGQANGDNDDDGAEVSTRKAKQSAMVAALFNLRTNAEEKVNLLTKVVELADTSALSPGESRGISALADMLEPMILQSTLKLWGHVNFEKNTTALRALYAAVIRGMDRVLAKLVKDKGGEDKSTAMKIKATRERKQTYLLRFLETYMEEVSTYDNVNVMCHRDGDKKPRKGARVDAHIRGHHL